VGLVIEVVTSSATSGSEDDEEKRKSERFSTKLINPYTSRSLCRTTAVICVFQVACLPRENFMKVQQLFNHNTQSHRKVRCFIMAMQNALLFTCSPIETSKVLCLTQKLGHPQNNLKIFDCESDFHTQNFFPNFNILDNNGTKDHNQELQIAPNPEEQRRLLLLKRPCIWI